MRGLSFFLSCDDYYSSIAADLFTCRFFRMLGKTTHAVKRTPNATMARTAPVDTAGNSLFLCEVQLL